MNVKHFLDGLIYLDTINLEEKLMDKPATSLFGDDLFFDLSKCQFAELGALAQLILIIESYLKGNHNIFIALPTTQFTTNQLKSKKDPSRLEDSLNKQISTSNFIKKTGFVNVLQKLATLYNKTIYFTDDYNYSQKDSKIDKESFLDSFSVKYDDVIINESSYKFLMPFKLIQVEKNNSNEIINEFEESLDKVLKNEERGINNFDVKVIKNVIIPELIKNVMSHSLSKYAILTIGLINSNSIFYVEDYETYLLKPGAKRKINKIEYSHYKRIKENNLNSQVEIYFGDCGIGILNNDYIQKLKIDFNRNISNPEEQLRLSFNRWSSIQDNKERRGTKGLYRLKRIVDKYKGMVHIKTSSLNGGFFNGEFDCRKLDSPFNGTFISIKTNSFKEIKSFKISNDRNISTIPWISGKISLDRELNCLELVKSKIINEHNLLLITDISNLDFSVDNKIFENFLYNISELSHPSAIVVYLINNNENLDNESIATFTESVGARINEVKKDIKNVNNNSLAPDSDDPELEEIHDPVLVIANNNETFWYGGSEKLINIIDESYQRLQENDSCKINELNAYSELIEEDQREIENYLETDNNIVVLNKNLEVEFNFYGIEKHYESKVKNFKPKIYDEDVCTPKLNTVKSWIEIPDLLKDDEYGFALCLYLKYRKNYEKNNKEITSLNSFGTYVLIDSNLQLNLTKKFIELLGIKNKNIRNIEDEIDYSMPKRTKLFNDNSNVIVLTTIISSSETIRRLVKYAKRDNARPEVVLCLMNSRTSNIERLETWNEITKIISIYQKNNTEQLTEIKNDIYFENKIIELNNCTTIINPKFKVETSVFIEKKVIVETDLLKYLKDNKYLHYNHYGQYNKRHFTFYLDKSRIINSIYYSSLISKRFIDTIKEWEQQHQIEKYTLYINKNLLGSNSEFSRFLKDSSILKYKYVDINENIILDTNSVYFDFGILTGDSINKLINRAEGIKNLLVCLLFNQTVNTNADIFKRIDSLKFERFTGTIPGASEKVKTNVNFNIEYLFYLPLSFFNSENCPICEHRKALDYYKLSDPYFEGFANDRRERLKQNSSDEINELKYPVDFYYSEKQDERKQELSNGVIFKMYELKILLENASFLTSSRIELYKLIHSLYQNIEVEIEKPESQIYSLLYYLSHEINWLQQEPLVFRDFRILLSKISYKIATIDMVELIGHFEKRNKFEIPSKNLVTRYKYSAISLLRSSDKLLFCHSIYDIVKSSHSENKFSDNLLQNTLYHISSFFKNTYNKSEIYFFYISNNLEKIQKDLEITIEQKNSIQFLLNENKKSRLKTYTVKKEPKEFRLFKQEWMKIYYETPGHPITYEHFKDIHISKVKDLLSNEGYIEKFNNTLQVNWTNLKMYLMNLFIEKFENHFHLLKNSSYFKQQFETTFGDFQNWRNIIQRIDSIINSFLANPNTYSQNENEYNELLDKIKVSVIQKKGLSDFDENSKLIYLLDNIPSNITECIRNVFGEFPNKTFNYLKNNQLNESLPINLNEEFYVYYPNSLLIKNFEMVRNNLKRRLNDGKKEDDVQLKFEIDTSEKNYLIMIIRYDCTNEKSGEIHKKGSLSGWNNSLLEFGGNLQYKTPEENNLDFEIKLKLLRYEF